ncbi:MAG: hypothetical protein HKN84_03740 [Gammaproteobacteria bacterium]|nr:hypothetical protein [Gammaproteobacteria bacterium]
MVRAIPLILSVLAASLELGLAHAEPISRPGDLEWAADVRLRWEDFQGPVDSSAAAERVAMTAASLSWGYSYGLELGSGPCYYRITSIDVAAIFNRQDSWVRPGHLTGRVLEHEQGHFDITQLFKLKLEEMTRDLMGVRRACEGRSVEAASQYTEREAARAVSAVADKIWREHVAAQEAYDDQTHHGTTRDVQAEWLQAIGHGLEAGQWSSIADRLD